MKRLIEIQQPCDYYSRGRTIWINPDDVVSVRTSELGETVVTLRNRESYRTDHAPKTVAQMVEDAL